MTLEEAIQHCEENVCDNSLCSMEHKQLAEWLKELQALKRNNSIEERAKEHSKGQWDELTAKNAYIAGATAQKAIDEEVRLKKCDDMTQEECDREVAFAKWYRENGKGTPTYSDAIEWARKEVINKACDWFAYYLMDIGYPDDWMRDSPNMQSGEERFRKAMEK